MAKRKKNANGIPWLLLGGAGVGLYFLLRPMHRRAAERRRDESEDVLAIQEAEELLSTQIEEAQGVSAGAARRIAQRMIKQSSLAQINNRAFRMLLVERLVSRGVPRLRARRIVARLARMRRKAEEAEETPAITAFHIKPKRALPAAPRTSSMVSPWSGEGTINYDLTTKGTILPGARTVIH